VSFVAAQCVQVDDPHLCRSLRRDAIVFEATVDNVENRRLPRQDPTRPVLPDAERLIHLRDIRAVRGTPRDVLVAPIMGSEDCFYQFRTGRRYAIVAMRLADGRLAPSDLTRPIETSAGLLAYVRSLGQSGKAQLWGTVSMPAEWTEWEVTYGPVPEARVTVRGPVTRSATTDAHGEYRFADLPRGQYSIDVDLPETSAFLRPLETHRVEFRSSDPCAEISFAAKSRSRIQGVVVDERGQPVPDAFVMLQAVDYRDRSGIGDFPGMGLQTNAQGRYVFSDLPPGRYIVGVNHPSRSKPYLEAYASTSGGETTLSLDMGERVILEPLRLTRLSPRTIAGVVLSKNGEPMAGVQVSLWWTSALGHLRGGTVGQTDDAGRFRIAAWQGIEYRVEIGPHDAPSAQVAVPDSDDAITVIVPGR
jgi:protocatechuate 3,4-dioxygenase beta subunit